MRERMTEDRLKRIEQYHKGKCSPPIDWQIQMVKEIRACWKENKRLREAAQDVVLTYDSLMAVLEEK